MVRYSPDFGDGHFPKNSHNAHSHGPSSRRTPPSNAPRAPNPRLADRFVPTLEDRINAPLHTELPRPSKSSYDGPNSGSSQQWPKPQGGSYKNNSLDNRISSSTNQNYNMFDNAPPAGSKYPRPSDNYTSSKRARPNDTLHSRIEGDGLSHRITTRSSTRAMGDYRTDSTTRGRTAYSSSRGNPKGPGRSGNRSLSPRNNTRPRGRDEPEYPSESNHKTKQVKPSPYPHPPPPVPLAMRLENGDNNDLAPRREREQTKAVSPVIAQDLFPHKQLTKPQPRGKLAYVDIGESPHPDLLIEMLSEPVLLELQRQEFTRLRINYGEHRHVYRLLIRKARTIAGGIHIHSDHDQSYKSPAYMCADLVVLHSGPRLLQALKDKKALIVVGYDGWMTVEQRDVLGRLYAASALTVTESGHVFNTLKNLDIDALNPSDENIPPRLFISIADAKEPRLRNKVLDDLQMEVMSSTTAGSKLDDVNEPTTRERQNSSRRQTPVPEILGWLQKVRLSDKDINQPPSRTHLRRIIQDDSKFQSVVRLVAEARKQPGFPGTVPPLLSIFHEAISRDYDEELELNLKRKIRIEDFRKRRTREMEQFEKEGTFPLKQYVWKEVEIDKTHNLEMFSRTRSKKQVGRVEVKMERLSPSPESEVSPAATERSPTATSDDTPVSDDMPIDPPEKPELPEKMDVESAQPSPPPPNPTTYESARFSVPILQMTPKPTNQHIAYPTPFSVSPAAPEPTDQDIAVLYCILSTFPFTEIWVIPRVYEVLLSKPWPFPTETDRDIATFVKKHLPFYKVAGENLVTYDPKENKLLRSRSAQLSPLSECTIEGLSDRISELISALSPSDQLVRKVWHLAYRGLLFPREVAGQKFESYDQFQRVRGILPLTEQERIQHAGDFVEYAADRVREKWDTIDVAFIKTIIERRQTEE